MVKTRDFSKRRRRTRSRSSTGARVAYALLMILCIVVIAWLRRPSSHTNIQLGKTSRSVPQIISRQDNVKITTDVRGNLGPASVLNQDPPGTDWIKDRWQAASDMHGTAIKGAHWVIMEFPSPITTSHIVLDWEAALSKDYKIEVNSNHDDDDDEWTAVFDTSNDFFDSQEFGQSPGVKTKTPLHIVHNITTSAEAPSFTRLRIWIRSSAHGWGVSLWQVDVYGWYEQ